MEHWRDCLNTGTLAVHVYLVMQEQATTGMLRFVLCSSHHCQVHTLTPTGTHRCEWRCGKDHSFEVDCIPQYARQRTKLCALLTLKYACTQNSSGIVRKLAP